MNATVPASVAATAPAPAGPKVQVGDLIFVQLAREIAMDMIPLEDILKNHEITTDRWNEIKANSRFQAYLLTAVTEWNTALNTGERVRLKALAAVEEALPEFYARMHDKNEALPAKVRALEIIGKIGGVGVTNQQAPAAGEKFSVTINLGNDQQLKVIGDSRTPAVDVLDQ